jgi:hypothetical protein
MLFSGRRFCFQSEEGHLTSASFQGMRNITRFSKLPQVIRSRSNAVQVQARHASCPMMKVFRFSQGMSSCVELKRREGSNLKEKLSIEYGLAVDEGFKPAEMIVRGSSVNNGRVLESIKHNRGHTTSDSTQRTCTPIPTQVSCSPRPPAPGLRASVPREASPIVVRKS